MKQEAQRTESVAHFVPVGGDTPEAIVVAEEQWDLHFQQGVLEMQKQLVEELAGCALVTAGQGELDEVQGSPDDAPEIPERLGHLPLIVEALAAKEVPTGQCSAAVPALFQG